MRLNIQSYTNVYYTCICDIQYKRISEDWFHNVFFLTLFISLLLITIMNELVERAFVYIYCGNSRYKNIYVDIKRERECVRYSDVTQEIHALWVGLGAEFSSFRIYCCFCSNLQDFWLD